MTPATTPRLGDTLMFVRYAPLVRRLGGTVLLECPGSLIPLLSTCPGIDRLVAEGASLPEFDVQAPLMSLPGLVGTTLETVPAAMPYLGADAERVKRWGEVLDRVPGFKVGIVWQGNPRFQWDRHRSMPLTNFEPLAKVDGVHLVSLQKGPGVEQLRQVGGHFPVVDLGEELDDEEGAFLDTAAVMKNLDLVVCADTAAGHLAGALGVPVWLALSRVADWRWMAGRDDSPWYPTMRLFRQRRLGDWRGVFRRMASRLRRRRPCGGPRVELSPGELIDKLTILEIKSERITDTHKLAHVRQEQKLLGEIMEGNYPASQRLAEFKAALKGVNERLWDVENELRLCERDQEFGSRFVELAREVYRTNDQRASLKRQINELLGSRLQEQKEYPLYAQ